MKGADPNVAAELVPMLGATGGLDEAVQEAGRLRIRVYHTGAFPWAQVLKLLLYREFQVKVTNRKADIFIEAQA